MKTREERLQYHREWYKKNKEHVRKRYRKYYLENKEAISERNTKWLSDHPERVKKYRETQLAKNKSYNRLDGMILRMEKNGYSVTRKDGKITATKRNEVFSGYVTTVHREIFGY